MTYESGIERGKEYVEDINKMLINYERSGISRSRLLIQCSEDIMEDIKAYVGSTMDLWLIIGPDGKRITKLFGVPIVVFGDARAEDTCLVSIRVLQPGEIAERIAKEKKAVVKRV